VDAIAALTATAEAQPTSTPIPSPTATPEPSTVSGKIRSTDGGSLTVEVAEGAAPVTYTVADDARIVRDGEQATVDDLAANDAVSLLVDGVTGAVIQASADSPASPGVLARIGWLTWLLPFALILPPLFWFRRRSGLEPFIVREAAV
jgi:hypothetical protein